MYKALVFFDLDNTLLNAQTRVDPEVAAAMDSLRQNNVLPVISTGRNIFEIPNTMRNTKIDTVVSGNGDYVIYEGKPVYAVEFPKTLVAEMAAYAADFEDAVAVLNSKESHMNKVTKLTQQAYDSVNSTVPPLGAEEFWQNNQVNMMIVMTQGHDADYRLKFGDQLTFYRNTPFSMDIVLKGNSKSEGIKQLIKNAGLEGIPTYAFGDGNNDIPMLDFVDHPVAMGNALDNVKPYAEFITTNNTDHGIVNGLKHFDLI
ncbi:Cof-type HAD-IIB family hydrolase [Lentilactobacillus kribbianus]|uniref:Cof-type HAD-IIB family hydrolase n=1 Tax=Lentilactobacillus kribbianus TaxID=2729622 RepID=UPI0015549E42|nr:Cof-type HAD-IIB family hydrolase [Lentilactobacillus kribbianus]